jgi:DNA ligase-associated metallophosphoesterase
MKIPFADQEITLTPQGALWIENIGLLCVADLHFEKDSFFDRFATFLPPYGSIDTLHRLEQLINIYEPHILIAAGDSFHDPHAAERMHPEIASKLNSLTEKVKSWHWIIGNHDPEISSTIKGTLCAEMEVNGIVFRHKTIGNNDWEISGHYHPKARFSVHGHFFNAACYVQHKRQLFLPAFGAYTGGLNIDSETFCGVAPKKERNVFPIYNDQILKLRDD